MQRSWQCETYKGGFGRQMCQNQACPFHGVTICGRVRRKGARNEACRVSLPHTSSQKLTTICKMTVTSTYMLHKSKKHAEMSSTTVPETASVTAELPQGWVTPLCHGNPPLETITDTKHEKKIGTNKNKNTATYRDRIQFLHDAIVAQSFLCLKLILGHDLGAGQGQLVFLDRTVETKYPITETKPANKSGFKKDKCQNISHKTILGVFFPGLVTS